MAIKPIRPDQFQTTAWSGGITEEIFIYPPDASYQDRNFIYRISTALVEAERSIFTPLPDYTRYIAPLNGSLKLAVDLREIELEPFEVFKFDGAAKVSSNARPALRDLNLMVRKGHSGELEIMRADLVLDPASTQVVLCLKLDRFGEFWEIAEALVIPQGTILNDRDWNKDPTAGATIFAVFTLPEASEMRC